MAIAGAFGSCQPEAAMSLKEPSFTIGIEEEYLLVDLETRDLAKDPPRALMEACEKELAQLTNVLGVVLNKCRYEDEGAGYAYGTYG